MAKTAATYQKFPMGNSRNSFKYFLNFSTWRSNFSKKCQGSDFEICGVIDQVDHGESEYEVKTGTGSSFLRHFGEKPIFWIFLGPVSPLLWGVTRPIFGAVSYVWGRNIAGKFQGRSSRASYICQVRACWHFGVSAHVWGGRLPPA